MFIHMYVHVWHTTLGTEAGQIRPFVHVSAYLHIYPLSWKLENYDPRLNQPWLWPWPWLWLWLRPWPWPWLWLWPWLWPWLRPWPWCTPCRLYIPDMLHLHACDVQAPYNTRRHTHAHTCPCLHASVQLHTSDCVYACLYLHICVWDIMPLMCLPMTVHTGRFHKMRSLLCLWECSRAWQWKPCEWINTLLLGVWKYLWRSYIYW